MDRFALDKLKNVMDEAKSVVKAKMGTDVERKIEEALSNKNWGASSTLLNELSQLTYDYEAYGVITRKIWEAMDAEGRQWRSVYKALSLLEHLIKNGTERVIENARDHMFKLRHLSGFSYHDGSVDRGNGVRDKAKQLVDMLNDNDMIRTEREKAGRLRNKYVGIGSGLGGGMGGGSYVGSSNYSEERSGGGYSGGSGYNNGSGNSYSGGGYSGGGGYSSGGGYSGGGGSRDYGVSGSKTINEKEKSYSTRNVDDDRVDESEESESEEEVRPKRRASSLKGKAAAKKKEEAKSKAAVKSPPAEASLLDADFFSPAPVAAAANTFDPFAPASAGVAAAQPAQPQTASFAAFGNATPTPQQSFDAFGAPQPKQQPAFNAFGSSSFTREGTPQLAAFPAAPTQQGLNALGQQANAAASHAPAFNVQQHQQQFRQFGGMSSVMPQPGQSGMDVQCATSSQSGYNTSGSQSRTNPAPKPEEKKSDDAWGAGSSLYDLNNLGSSSGNNSSSANHPGQHPRYQHQQLNASCNSFSGLDTLAGLPSKPTVGGAGGMNMGMGGMSYAGGMGMGHSGMQQQAALGQMGQGSMVMGITQHRPMMGGMMGMQQPGMGMQQPGVGMQQPGMGMQQPGMGMQQPGMGMQPGVGRMANQGGFGGIGSMQQQRQQQAFNQFGNFS